MSIDLAGYLQPHNICEIMLLTYPENRLDSFRLPSHPRVPLLLTGTLDTALAARTSSGSHAISMWVPPPAAAARATLETRSASNLLSPEITCEKQLRRHDAVVRVGVVLKQEVCF